MDRVSSEARDARDDKEGPYMATFPCPARVEDLELFADCTKEELRLLDGLATPLHMPKGQVLMREGTIGREFVIIGSGTACVWRQTSDGAEEVAEVGSGDFLGEIALLTGVRRTATATATTDLSVLVSSVSEFRTMLRVAPSVAEKVRRASTVRAASIGLAA
jgi:CRP-like cAMP-binding protein